MEILNGAYVVALNAIETAAGEAINFKLLQFNSESMEDYQRALQDVITHIASLRQGEQNVLEEKNGS